MKSSTRTISFRRHRRPNRRIPRHCCHRPTRDGTRWPRELARCRRRRAGEENGTNCSSSLRKAIKPMAVSVAPGAGESRKSPLLSPGKLTSGHRFVRAKERLRDIAPMWGESADSIPKTVGLPSLRQPRFRFSSDQFACAVFRRRSGGSRRERVPATDPRRSGRRSERNCRSVRRRGSSASRVYPSAKNHRHEKANISQLHRPARVRVAEGGDKIEIRGAGKDKLP